MICDTCNTKFTHRDTKAIRDQLNLLSATFYSDYSAAIKKLKSTARHYLLHLLNSTEFRRVMSVSSDHYNYRCFYSTLDHTTALILKYDSDDIITNYYVTTKQVIDQKILDATNSHKKRSNLSYFDDAAVNLINNIATVSALESLIKTEGMLNAILN